MIVTQVSWRNSHHCKRLLRPKPRPTDVLAVDFAAAVAFR